MKFKRICEGQQAIIYNHLGIGRVVEGPDRVFLFRERLTILQQYRATQYQYLRVTYNTGAVEHIPGPCEMFKNPLEHSSIVTQDGTAIDGNHMVVVYRRLADNSVERRIVQGPTLLIPQADEWLHEFSWHGEDGKQIGHMVPNLCKFKQLSAIPNQFYYNVRDVRTTDDTMLTVKLMIFYEMTDVITMLETTHDPIADMINAVCADVIAFAGKLTFQQFLKQTRGLSDLATYNQLHQRTERMGYKACKVVYRGYHASDQLQAMHDNAIQSRTELRLNAELAEQQQKLTDFKLQKEQGRAHMKQEMEREKVEHRQNIERMKNTHQARINEQELNTKLECQKIQHDMEREWKDKEAEQQAMFLSNLRGLDLDLTLYLVNQGPGKIDQELHVLPRPAIASALSSTRI